MTYNNNYTLLKEYPKKLIANGLESLPEMIRVLLIQAMRIERVKFLSAKIYILQAGEKIYKKFIWISIYFNNMYL